MVYADFEALLKATTDNDKANVFATHKPVAWAYYIKCYYPQHEDVVGAGGKPLGQLRSFCGPYAIHNFLESLAEDAEACEEIVKRLEYAQYTGDVPQEYLEATHCHICGKEGFSLDDQHGKWQKVLDHDHLTGLYRGAAHSHCNLQYYSSKYWRLPVFFHNLRGYDGYHILRGLKGYTEGIEELKCIAKSLDKFTSFDVDNLRFADSMQFLLGSLDSNVEGMKKGLSTEQLKVLFKPVVDYWGLHDDDYRFKLLMGKGVYPYEYMTNIEVMEEEKLPPKEAFFSKLNNANISDADYQRALECFEAFGCCNLRDYTLLYVALDVLQLASAFEKLRSTMIPKEALNLDPAHFITAPSLAWHGMLLMNYKNGVEIENMTDLSMLMMVEKGVRGGITMVFNPRLVANENRQGFYWDANNLYGWTMRNPMPLGRYRWEKLPVNPTPLPEDVLLDEEQPSIETETHEQLAANPDFELWHREDMQSLTEDLQKLDPFGERGYILEVDIEYPDVLHDRHDDMPFLPESKICHPSEHTIKQMEKIYHTFNTKNPPPCKKLVCDFEPKNTYVIHYRMLQEALKQGLVLKKVHRVFSFDQSEWLRPFIDFVTKMRSLCTDEAAKSNWKLIANSIYGKMVENVRSRKEIEMIFGDKAKTQERSLRVASSPWIKNFKIVIPDELLFIERYKKKCILNRPVVIGFTVLEISKLHMYDMKYNVLNPTFGEDLTCHYMDTDSFVLSIKGSAEEVADKLYDIQMSLKSFDLSKIAIANPNHPLLKDRGRGPPPLCANDIGKFKDEMNGVRITNAIFLRPKSYSVEVEGGKMHLRMKGVPVKRAQTKDGEKITHDTFLRVRKGEVMPKVRFQRIDHSKDLQVRTVETEKLGLTNTDDKRFYFNEWESLSYGHWRIKEYLD